MRLASLTTSGVAGVRDGTVRFGDENAIPPDLIAITGPAASGKTAWLRAVVAGKESVAPYGPRPNPQELIAHDATAAKIVQTWWLDPSEVEYAGVSDPEQRLEVVFKRTGVPASDADPGLIAVLDRYGHHGAFGIVDLLPETRDLSFSASDGGRLVDEQRKKRMSFAATKYAGLVRYARESLQGGTTIARELLRDVSKELCPWLALGEVDDAGYPEFKHAGGATVRFKRLSASERQLFLFAANFVMTTPSRATILVDRPEKDLAAGEAARVIEALRKRQASNQWIVATNDGKLLEAVSREGLVRLEAA